MPLSETQFLIWKWEDRLTLRDLSVPKYSQYPITSCYLHFYLVQVTVISCLYYTITSLLSQLISRQMPLPLPPPSPWNIVCSPLNSLCDLLQTLVSSCYSLLKTPHVTWSKNPNPHNSQDMICFPPPLPLYPHSLPPSPCSLAPHLLLEHTCTLWLRSLALAFLSPPRYPHGSFPHLLQISAHSKASQSCFSWPLSLK